jgi:acetylglutamate synthase
MKRPTRGNPDWVDNKKSGNVKGRPKGHLNKFTEIKLAFIQAFNDLEKNDKTKLSTWSKSNQPELYNLIVRMMPKDVDISGDIDVNESDTRNIISDAALKSLADAILAAKTGNK